MTGPDPSPKKPTRATSPKTRAPASAVPPVSGSEEPASPIVEAEIVEEAVAATPEPVVAAVAPVAPVAAASAPEVPAVVAPPAATAPPTATAAPAAPAPPVAVAAPALPAVPVPAPASESQPVAAAPPVTAPAPAPTPRSTPDVGAAVDKAVDRLRTHLTVGEIVAGLGAVIILGVAWGLFGVIFGHGGTWPSDLVILLCLALLFALLLQNAHIHDFGPNYRLLVAGICFALGIIAVLSVLRELRFVINNNPFDIGGLSWWAGAWIAVLGGFMVWREGR